MRVTVGAEAAPMCLQRSAPPDAVEDAPSLDPWLKATSGGRLATFQLLSLPRLGLKPELSSWGGPWRATDFNLSTAYGSRHNQPNSQKRSEGDVGDGRGSLKCEVLYVCLCGLVVL